MRERGHKRNVDEEERSSNLDDGTTWWESIAADTYPPSFLGPVIAINPESLDEESMSLGIDHSIHG